MAFDLGIEFPNICLPKCLAMSDLGLHCLLRPVYPNEKGKCSILSLLHFRHDLKTRFRLGTFLSTYPYVLKYSIT